MKYFHLIIIVIIVSVVTAFTIEHTNEKASIKGAWSTTFTDASGNTIQGLSIVQDKFFATCYYNLEDRKFYNTFGGKWNTSSNMLNIEVLFSSNGTPRVGEEINTTFNLTEKTLQVEGDRTWDRVDHGMEGDLSEAWFFAGRKRNGEMSRRDLGPRKTMKILSETKFQWIAFNDETGDFFGTGGGSYSAKEGKYQENIEFFSRDSSRVGAALGFDFEIKDGEWHHSGFSSKGDPMYEIWSTFAILSKAK
jgi:hypothetical protein